MQAGRAQVRGESQGWKDPLEKGMAAHSSILAWRIHGQRSLVGYSPWGRKESDTTERDVTHIHETLGQKWRPRSQSPSMAIASPFVN